MLSVTDSQSESETDVFLQPQTNLLVL